MKKLVLIAALSVIFIFTATSEVSALGVNTESQALAHGNLSEGFYGAIDPALCAPESEAPASNLDTEPSLETPTESFLKQGYIITEDSGSLVLSGYLEGVPKEIARGNFTEILDCIPEGGAYVVLDGIVLDSFELTGSYVFTGAISLNKGATLTLGEDCSLSFVDTAIQLAEGALIRVRGGSVRLTDCSVTSSGSIFLTEMNSDSELIIENSTVTSSTDSAAITHSRGKLILRDSIVTNTLGTAVNSTSTMYLSGDSKLCGVGYDLVSSAEVMLSGSYGEYTPSSVTEVYYPSTFARGGAYIIFHGAKKAHSSMIMLYDRDGRQSALSYFESADFTDETDFLAVYLPYTVRYYGREGVLFTEQRLSGENPFGFDYKPSKGYTAVGWYLDRDCNERYSFDTPVISDLDLYVKEKLVAPIFTLSSVNKVYDGKEQTLGFSSLSHPLDGEGGMYFYRWFKDGTEISTASFLRVCGVKDSGSYSCIITYSYRSDTVTVTAENVTVSITKRSVAIPELEPVFYDGQPHAPNITPSALYNVEEVKYTDAGEYTVLVTLTDSSDYTWEGTDSGDVELTFSILKANNSWSEEICAYDIYYGAEVNVKAISRFGTVRLLYSRTEDGEYTEIAPSSIGVYYVIAIVDGTDNYTDLKSAPLSFEVLREYALTLSVLTAPKKISYKAFEHFEPYGLSLAVTYNSGRVETVGEERISYKYQRADSFRADDNALLLSYAGISVMLEVDVAPTEYDLSGFVFSSEEKVYNAKYMSIDKPEISIIGADGIELQMSVIGGGSTPGEYAVTLAFSTDSTNYLIPNDITVTLKIIPFTVDIIWQNTEFIYDGSLKLPNATYLDVYGALRYASVIGGRTEAGDGYIATAVEDSPNYSYRGANTEFNILRADIDLSGVYWLGGDFTYDGKQKSVSIKGLPDTVTLVGYTDSYATLAGNYVATAAISYDERNFNKPKTLSYSWSISKANYPEDGFSFSSTIATFDGAPHYPTLTGNMPVGIDGYTLGYSFSRGATHVNDGSVEVVVNFTTDSTNYYVPDPITLSVRIIPKPVSVEWHFDNSSYDGKPHLPSAVCSYTPIRVEGMAVNAGRHTAFAYSEDPDYTVLNSEYVFRIFKADNFFLTPPTVSDVFLGKAPEPHALAHFGTPIFSYWLDADCTSAADLCSHGKVYLLVTVPESENYLELTSSPIPFTVMEVLAEGISVELVGSSIVAFSPLQDSDFVAWLCYNDGSVAPVPSDKVRVVYQTADSPRRTDSRIDFEYMGFSTSVSVSVDYADYDTSSIRWTSLTHTYDGTPKSPVLLGLPDGVTLIALTAEGQTEAGSYSYGAILDYDKTNYNPPCVPDCTLTVLPAVIPIPTVPDRVYNAKPYVPISTDERILFDSTPMTDSGEYTLNATLADSHNYRFEGGANEASITYRILPLPITVEVPTYDLYLWESVGSSTYSVISGEILEGDTVTLSETNDGSYIRVSSDNPNYVIYTVGGEIIRHDRLSPRAVSVLFLITVSVLLLLLFAVIVILQRERILDAVAAYRSRRSILKASLDEDKSDREGNIDSISRDIIHPENSSVPLTDESVADTEQKISHLTDECEGCDVSPSDDCSQTDTLSSELRVSEMPEELCLDPSDITAADPIDCIRADNLITDALAKDLLRRSREVIFTSGTRREIINVDTLSDSFSAHDRVDVNILKDKSLIHPDTSYVKVLARGTIDKPLKVYANDFSLSAVKMIALTGGEAIRVSTLGDDIHEPFDNLTES